MYEKYYPISSIIYSFDLPVQNAVVAKSKRSQWLQEIDNKYVLSCSDCGTIYTRSTPATSYSYLNLKGNLMITLLTKYLVACHT